jgi:hypothetical protein
MNQTNHIQKIQTTYMRKKMDSIIRIKITHKDCNGRLDGRPHAMPLIYIIRVTMFGVQVNLQDIQDHQLP